MFKGAFRAPGPCSSHFAGCPPTLGCGVQVFQGLHCPGHQDRSRDLPRDSQNRVGWHLRPSLRRPCRQSRVSPAHVQHLGPTMTYQCWDWRCEDCAQHSKHRLCSSRFQLSIQIFARLGEKILSGAQNVSLTSERCKAFQANGRKSDFVFGRMC